MGFIAGFANTLVDQYNRAQDAKKETDQIALKYRLDELSKQKEERRTKAETERKAAEMAETYTTSIGQPTLAPVVNKYLKMGYSISAIDELYNKGRFVRTPPEEQQTTIEKPNPEVVPQTSVPTSQSVSATSTDVAVPAGVKDASVSSQVHEKVGGEGNREEMEGYSAEQDRVDSQVRKISPDLIADSGSEKVTSTAEDNGWKLVPETVKEKIPPEIQVRALYDEARRNNDLVNMKKYERLLELYEEQRKASRTESDKPEDWFTFAPVNEKGEWDPSNNVITAKSDGKGGYVDKMGNPVDPNKVTIVTKEQQAKVGAFFNTHNANVMTYKSSLDGAVQTAMITSDTNEILKRNANNPSFLNPMTQAVLESANQVDQSFMGMRTALENLRQDGIDTMNDPNLTDEQKQEKLSSFSAKIADTYAAMQDKAEQSPLIGNTNLRWVIDKSLYDANILRLTYETAKGFGQTGQALSGKELERIQDTLTANDPKKAMERLQDNLRNVSLSIGQKKTSIMEAMQQDMQFQMLPFKVNVPSVTGVVERLESSIAEAEANGDTGAAARYKLALDQLKAADKYVPSETETNVTSAVQETPIKVNPNAPQSDDKGGITFKGKPLVEGKTVVDGSYIDPSLAGRKFVAIPSANNPGTYVWREKK